MPIPVADIVRRAGRVLNDEDHLRWTVPELIEWINDGAGEIVLYRPAAGAVTNAIALVEGAYQMLPYDALQLLDVIRNLDADGKPGRAVTRVDRHLIDSSDPNWTLGRKRREAKHYMADDRNPKAFYVYPPVLAGGGLEALYSRLPEPVTHEEGEVALDLSYTGPLLSYVLQRALSKDSEYANGQVAIAHYQGFQEALGLRTQTQILNSPKGQMNEAP